jgi:hypothetical protein
MFGAVIIVEKWTKSSISANPISSSTSLYKVSSEDYPFWVRPPGMFQSFL